MLTDCIPQNSQNIATPQRLPQCQFHKALHLIQKEETNEDDNEDKYLAVINRAQLMEDF